MRASVYTVLVAAASLMALSCAGVKVLHTERLKDASGVTGTYTLILYGSNHSNDLETVAVLDREGDAYDIEPYAPDWRYERVKGVGADEALERARAQVNFHPSFMRTYLKRIIGPDGSVIGYEVRPMYFLLSYGELDVIDVWYVPKDGGKVRMYVRLKDRVDIRLHGGGDSGSSGHEK